MVVVITLDVYAHPLPSDIPCIWIYNLPRLSSFQTKNIGLLQFQLSSSILDVQHMAHCVYVLELNFSTLEN
jgi:hypothetical protein